MLHLDEGTIHELLDGELDAPAAGAVRVHIAECPECLRLYQEAQELLSEADRVIASLSTLETAPASPAADTRVASPAAADVAAGTPLVLIPYNPSPRWRRPRRRSYFWAAGLAAMGAVGYMLTGVRQRELTRSSDMATRAFKSAPPPVVSRPVTSEPAAAGQPKAAAKTPPPPTTMAAAPKRSEFSPKLATPAAKQQQPAGSRAAIERAAAPPPAAPPAPTEAAADEPSPDARAQITTRIGLDEAKRQLGGPLHGIDGLRPAFIGIVPGRLVPGADPSRDVVRAVYVDASNRQFYLDQQQLSPSAVARTGTAADNASPRASGLARGDVQLMLHGQLPADTLSALEGRVR